MRDKGFRGLDFFLGHGPSLAAGAALANAVERRPIPRAPMAVSATAGLAAPPALR